MRLKQQNVNGVYLAPVETLDQLISVANTLIT